MLLRHDCDFIVISCFVRVLVSFHAGVWQYTNRHRPNTNREEQLQISKNERKTFQVMSRSVFVHQRKTQ